MIGKWRVLLPLSVALLVAAGMVCLLHPAPQPVRSAPLTLCVAPGGVGCDPGVCGGSCYASVQTALDAALAGDRINVATGVYTGVQARGGMTQVVYIDRDVTVRGGYNSDLTAWDPETYPTTLDAQGQGRVVSIVGSGITPRLEGFIITGGDATGVTLNCPNFLGTSDGCGGGIFAYGGGPVIVDNVVTHNVAGVSSGSHSVAGGGICIAYTSGAIISGNLIVSNTASLGKRGGGGGIMLSYPYDVVVEGNRILDNVATTDNTLVGSGGGIAVTGSGSAGIFRNNLIQGNRTNRTGGGYGAGIYHWYGSHSFQFNRVVGNYGSHAVFLGGYDGARFESNEVLDNHTSIGIEMMNGTLKTPVLVNNVIARSGGKSLSLRTSIAVPLTAGLVHNTLIGSGAGYGVVVETGYVTLVLTNTIVANTTWGITNTEPASSTVTADHTLFWANTQNGITGASPVVGDPAFSGSDGYRLGPGSAAIDAGVATSESLDIDGAVRPIGLAPDIGADEVLLRYVFMPLTLRAH